MFKLISFAMTLLFLAIGVTLGVLNPTPIELDLFFVKPVLPLSLVLALVFILGILLGASIILLQVVRLKWQLRRLTKLNQSQLNQILQFKKESISKQQVLSTPSNALVSTEKQSDL